MTKVTLPALPRHHSENWFTDASDPPTSMPMDKLYTGRQLRARDLEVAKVVLEAAAKLKADAMEIFNHKPGMTPQETRDVIEWYSASLSTLEFTHHD